MSTAAAVFAIVSILLLGPAMHERFGTHSMSAGPWIAFRLFVLSASLPGCGGLDECSPGAQAGSILGVECLGRLAEAVVETVKALGVTMATPTGVVSTGLVGICALHHSRYASCLRVQLAHLFGSSGSPVPPKTHSSSLATSSRSHSSNFRGPTQRPRPLSAALCFKKRARTSPLRTDLLCLLA